MRGGAIDAQDEYDCKIILKGIPLTSTLVAKFARASKSPHASNDWRIFLQHCQSYAKNPTNWDKHFEKWWGRPFYDYEVMNPNIKPLTNKPMPVPWTGTSWFRQIRQTT
jgi:hypothetical protein